MPLRLFIAIISMLGFANTSYSHSLDDHQHYHCHKAADCHSHGHQNDHH